MFIKLSDSVWVNPDHVNFIEQQYRGAEVTISMNNDENIIIDDGRNAEEIVQILSECD